jgi:predicted ArsR family transcriptional regulator
MATESPKKEGAVTVVKSKLPGTQVVLEGLIADILNEHFGETVELVGIALFRNGEMTFPELVRVINMNFLAFPRDSINPFAEYQKAAFAIETASFKTIRDALLVLIHHGLVSVQPSNQYSINAMEIVNRLLFPMVLESFEGPEKEAVEVLIKRSMVPKSELGNVLNELLSRRVVVSVDSLTTVPSSPRKLKSQAQLVVRLNSIELQLTVLNRYIVEYVESKFDAKSGFIVRELLEAVTSTQGNTFRSQISIGDLSVADLAKKLKMNSHDLISCLIKLQQAGVVGKQQFTPVAEEPVKSGPGRKRKAPARAKNTKQLLAMADSDGEAMEDDFADLVGGSAAAGSHLSGAPSYAIRFFDILEEIESELIFQIVKAKFGVEASRVFELLTQSGQKYEASHVADICAISREDALKHLHAFATEGMGIMQEVPKITTSASAASAGVAAMMRAVASSIWLYSLEPERVRRSIISLVSNSIVNLRRRFRFEVNRQCRIEDRATLLTKAEQQYLETVHAAQDILEGNSIQIVSSLLILLVRGK